MCVLVNVVSSRIGSNQMILAIVTYSAHNDQIIPVDDLIVIFVA